MQAAWTGFGQGSSMKALKQIVRYGSDETDDVRANRVQC